MTAIFWLSFAVLWVIVIIQGLAFLEVVRQLAQMREQLGPKQGALIVPGAVSTGAPLPDLVGLKGVDLKAASWEDYSMDGILAVLVVLRSRCSPCSALARDLTAFAQRVRHEATMIALVDGGVEEVRRFAAEAKLDLSMVIVDESGAMAERLGVTFSPGVVTVRDRRLGVGAIVNGVEQIHALMHDGWPELYAEEDTGRNSAARVAAN